MRACRSGFGKIIVGMRRIDRCCANIGQAMLCGMQPSMAVTGNLVKDHFTSDHAPIVVRFPRAEQTPKQSPNVQICIIDDPFFPGVPRALSISLISDHVCGKLFRRAVLGWQLVTF